MFFWGNSDTVTKERIAEGGGLGSECCIWRRRGFAGWSANFDAKFGVVYLSWHFPGNNQVVGSFETFEIS